MGTACRWTGRVVVRVRRLRARCIISSGLMGLSGRRGRLARTRLGWMWPLLLEMFEVGIEIAAGWVLYLRVEDHGLRSLTRGCY